MWHYLATGSRGIHEYPGLIGRHPKVFISPTTRTTWKPAANEIATKEGKITFPNQIDRRLGGHQLKCSKPEVPCQPDFGRRGLLLVLILYFIFRKSTLIVTVARHQLCGPPSLGNVSFEDRRHGCMSVTVCTDQRYHLPHSRNRGYNGNDESGIMWFQSRPAYDGYPITLSRPLPEPHPLAKSCFNFLSWSTCN